MKRSRLRQRTPLKARLNKDGRPREAFEGLRLEDFRAWIHAKRCLLHGERCRYANHQSDAAHVESKARGAGDEGNLVPLCRGHHQESHDFGQRSFEREHREALGGKALRVHAGEYWLAYEAEKGAPTL